MILNVGIDEGEGPPVVLLHGWPQHSGMWKQIVPTLSTRFRCIAPDLRGLGRSPAPPDGYDKPTLAADVIDTLDDLGIERARFVGHDWGTLVSAIIAMEHPERVEKALLFSAPVPWDRSLDPRQFLGIAHMPIMASPLGPRSGPAIGKQLMIRSRVPERDAEEYVAPMREPARRQAAALYYRTFLLRELPAALKDGPPARPDVPVRAVGGRSDPVCRWAKMDEKVRGGHFLPDTNPDAVIGQAMTFL